MALRRVAITGVGLVSCLGHESSQVVKALQNGASGLRAMPDWESLGLKSRVAGAITGVEAKFERSSIPKRLRPVISEASKYCCLAALDAVGDSGLSEADVQSGRTACIVGTGIGSVESIYTGGRQVHSGEIAKVSPFVVLRSMASASSAAVANLLKIHGRSYSISSACSTSSHSIGTAYELIRSGIVDRAVAGGGEEVHPLIAAGFQALRFALASKFNERPEQASRPYDVARDGFEAMKQVFDGKPPPFSSTKSMTGHPLGAAGALETIFCVGMLEHRFIAPSINIEELDPDFAGMPIVTAPKFTELHTILSNSFGFGGTNASLLLKAFRG